VPLPDKFTDEEKEQFRSDPQYYKNFRHQIESENNVRIVRPLELDAEWQPDVIGKSLRYNEGSSDPASRPSRLEGRHASETRNEALDCRTSFVFSAIRFR
jgi:hypothetical protein